MIAFVHGTIIQKGQGSVTVRSGDIGYRVFVGTTWYAEVSVGDVVDVYTHHHISETADDLCGFQSPREMELYLLLLSVSGIGPKSALAVLSSSSVDDVKGAIATGDASILTKVSGIGKKTAERIVLELRGKIDYIAPAAGSTNAISSDEIDALMALGYSLQQAREALKHVDSTVTDSGERIRAALRGLGR